MMHLRDAEPGTLVYVGTRSMGRLEIGLIVEQDIPDFALKTMCRVRIPDERHGYKYRWLTNEQLEPVATTIIDGEEDDS